MKKLREYLNERLRENDDDRYQKKSKPKASKSKPTDQKNKQQKREQNKQDQNPWNVKWMIE